MCWSSTRCPSPLIQLTLSDYRNVFYSAFMPIISSQVFDDSGKPYDVSRILTPDYHFDREAYRNYSKVYLPITYALSYGVQFASLSALITHTVCWHARDIWQQSQASFIQGRGENRPEYQPIKSGMKGRGVPRSSTTEPSMTDPDMSTRTTSEDVHCRLMRRYKDVPAGWYLGTFITMLAIGIFVVEYYPVYLPWYGLLLALAITAVLFIPVAIVMALTNQHSSLYLVSQMICGYVFPGRPVANMVSPPSQIHRIAITKYSPLTGVRHILLHQLRTRHQILLRPQTRPLHENPSQTPLQSPNSRHPNLKLYPNRRSELDVQLHPEHLHA